MFVVVSEYCDNVRSLDGAPLVNCREEMMKYRRFNAKRDEVEPEIVQALERAGWEVHRELPVDLLCLKRDGDSVRVKLLEAKTARGKKKPKAILDKRQVKQNEFCARWQIEKPTCASEALLAVGEKISL